MPERLANRFRTPDELLDTSADKQEHAGAHRAVDQGFSPVQAQEIVKDLYKPNALIYWVDFLFSVSIGWAAFLCALAMPGFSPWQIPACLVASLSWYRSVIFIHELSHLPAMGFRLFRLVWNLICGIPLMVPSFTYVGVHLDHHRKRLYGTTDDGEYWPFGASHPRYIVLHLLLSFLAPLLFVGRFVFLTPLSWLHAGWRRIIWERASSLAIDLSYRRPPPGPRDGKTWRLQELAAFVFGATVITLVATGRLGGRVLVTWYVIVAVIFLFNSVRTLAAHAYRHSGPESMSFLEQFLDSVDVSGNRVWTALWAPVGLRYHATHHLLPRMPYHRLGEAHRRLLRQLPEDSPYHNAIRNSLWDALARLWHEAQLVRADRA